MLAGLEKLRCSNYISLDFDNFRTAEIGKLVQLKDDSLNYHDVQLIQGQLLWGSCYPPTRGHAIQE
jgi:hypothetical protein